MDSLLRGEDMALCQIYFQSQVTYQCMSHLGEMGLVQFRDVSIVFILIVYSPILENC